jgi:hypothetical protein
LWRSAGQKAWLRPSAISPEQLQAIQRLSSDIRQVWSATTTTDRDRKELLRTLLEEVIVNLKRTEGCAHLTLRWRGGAFTTLDVSVPQFKPMGPRTAEDTISLLRRDALHQILTNPVYTRSSRISRSTAFRNLYLSRGGNRVRERQFAPQHSHRMQIR